MSRFTRIAHFGRRGALAIVLVVAVGAAIACTDPTSPVSQPADVAVTGPNAIKNGHYMSNEHEARSGLVRIDVYHDGRLSTHCSATILKSSKITNETWLLTAAHCFYKKDGIDQELHRIAGTPSVKISWYGAGVGSLAPATPAKVYIHPDWDSHVDGGNGIWYDYPDVAVIRFGSYVPVENEYGYQYVEFTRPFLASTTERYEGDDVGVFGLRDALRWARGTFKESRSGYLVIDGGDWKTSEAEIEPGDSGGPWLYSNGGESSTELYVRDGVVLGVTSGPHADATPFSYPPVDYFATNVSSSTTTNFILAKTNNEVPTVDNVPWRRQPTAQYSVSGTGAWTPLPRTSRSTGNIAVADFGPNACDGGTPRDDLFLAENGRWFVSWCGAREWTQIGTSSTEVSDKYGLAFGDFNGDGKADVFRASGGEWKVSYGGSNPWTTLKVSSTELKDAYGLGFGDFNGDGKTDVFRANGTEWNVSYSGTGSWTVIKTSSTKMTDEHGLAFGDFNGDGKTDVFRANGTEWNVSYSGTGAWTVIKSSTTQPTDERGLLIGDFNGDGKSDVFRATGTEWLVSYGGVGAWTKLKDSGKTTRELAVGNLAGDAASDIILARNPVTCATIFGNFCNVFFYLNNTAP